MVTSATKRKATKANRQDRLVKKVRERFKNIPERLQFQVTDLWKEAQERFVEDVFDLVAKKCIKPADAPDAHDDEIRAMYDALVDEIERVFLEPTLYGFANV